MNTPDPKSNIAQTPEPTADEKFLEQSTAKSKDPVFPAPETATRAPEPHAPKDGTDGSIVLRPQNSGSE